jgi:hypothetical protein
MSRARRGEGPAPRGHSPSLALGFLAALPLFLAYELAHVLEPGRFARAAAESAVLRGLAPLGENLQLVRLVGLMACALGAVLWEQSQTRRGAAGLLLDVGREVGLGSLAGLALGPLLVALLAWLGAGPLASEFARPRALVTALRLVGAAPWEELLFRVAAYGGVYLAAHRAVQFLGLAGPVAQGLAELVALLVSALVFAAFHLEPVQRLLGSTGEPFHAGLFLWRTSAGLLLGGLFRWRGLGVAAWAHAVFNLGVALGLVG